MVEGLDVIYPNILAKGTQGDTLERVNRLFLKLDPCVHFLLSLAKCAEKPPALAVGMKSAVLLVLYSD
jgi:hypothetical protein